MIYNSSLLALSGFKNLILSDMVNALSQLLQQPGECHWPCFTAEGTLGLWRVNVRGRVTPRAPARPLLPAARIFLGATSPLCELGL